MKNFLFLTSILEGSTGIAITVAPQILVPLLLSTSLEETGGIISARIAGIAITVLAMNCWFSRNEKNIFAIMYSMAVYNFAIIAIFIYAGMVYQLASLLLWLVVVAHAGLGLWGIVLLRKNVIERQ
ncbi:MAG: hypothetical protein HC811_06230 [Flammeovirgaceae bacterium]|nr:hypothetical protein [Flammeovirgaceae bacterium]